MRRLALLLALAGCHDWDALSSVQDFTGNYAIIVTNGQNGCMIGGPSSNWMPGMKSDAISLNVHQTGANHDQVDAQIGGVVGDFINFFCGSKDLIGSVDRDKMNASIMCTKDTMSGTCSYRYLAHAVATLSGDTITGSIDYTTVITTDTADCAPYRNCTSTQTFTGNR